MSQPAKRVTSKKGTELSLGKVHEAALKLSHEERVELIDLLEISLDQKKLDAVEAAWAKEVKRRSAEIDAGTAKFYSWKEVKAMARARPVRVYFRKGKWQLSAEGKAELDRRWREYKSGRSKASTWEEVRKRVRAKHAAES